MKIQTRLVELLVAGTLVVLGASCGIEDAPAPEEYGTYEAPLLPGTTPSGLHIVVLDSTADPDRVAHSAGASTRHVYRHAIRGFAAPLPPAALEHLRHNPRVLYIQPDAAVYAVAQTLPEGIDRAEADGNPIAAIDGIDGEIDVDIAVIDSGVDLDHPDLNVAGGVQFTKGRNRRGDDDNGHGTHCAGTIAARDNNIGVVGMAPGARIWALKALGKDGSGYRSDVIAAIDWVTANAATIEVVNMSLSGSGSDDTDGGDCRDSLDAYHEAICNSVHAGVVYVVAAGNASTDAGTRVPAAFDEVITVSALADFDGEPGGAGSGSYAFSSCTEDVDDSFACFSNYGHDVDIIAPGVGIYSTYMRGGYEYSSGTSMASPHVAGGVALYIAEHGRAYDYAGVSAIRQAVVGGGDPAPCASPTGACGDDPDGVQEPLLNVGVAACQTAAECDDLNDCTDDTCVAGDCVFAPVAENTTCGGGGGLCCSGACTAVDCDADADCNDGSECTADRCLNAGTCAATCDNGATPDGTACASGECCGGVCCGDLCCDGACEAPSCQTAADCGDSQTCTLDECLDAGTCAAQCANTWPACGTTTADLCCGPECDVNNDVDCQPACALRREACSVDSDCCSNNCKKQGWCG